MDFEGNHRFAKYQSFRMADEAEKYKLVLGAFVEGNAGQSLHGSLQWPGLQLGVGEAEKLLGVLALPPRETLDWGLPSRGPASPCVIADKKVPAFLCNVGARDALRSLTPSC